MQPGAPAAQQDSRRQRVLVIALAIAIVGALAALVAWVWYPTTLQPAITLTNTPFVGTRCAPVLGGGYANRFNTTFTLVNTGRADADAGVQFLLGNFSLGFLHYQVPQGSRVTDNASVIWEVHASPDGCGPLDSPGPPAVSLASVTRLPVIDVRQLTYATVNPVATAGFAGGILGGLTLLARRRGISLLRDLHQQAWVVAILVMFAASLFNSVVVSALTIPYNYPPDWTPLFIYGPIYGAIGVGTMIATWRVVLRAAPRSSSVPTK